MGLSLETLPRMEKSFGFSVCLRVCSLFFLSPQVSHFIVCLGWKQEEFIIFKFIYVILVTIIFLNILKCHKHFKC